MRETAAGDVDHARGAGVQRAGILIGETVRGASDAIARGPRRPGGN